LYWKIKNAHTVTIPRDKEWFAKVFPILQDTWAKVCHFREHLEELPLVQELADKRKAFYRYKTEFKVNNFEPNTAFLDESKPKSTKYSKPTNTGYKKSTYKNSNYKNTKTESKPKSNDCEFIDD
jgi:hypothetical protein